MEEKEAEQAEFEEGSWKKPLKAILALALVIILIITLVPYYSIKVNPEPEKIPALYEVIPLNLEVQGTKFQINNTYDMRLLVDPDDGRIKYTANRIVTRACENSDGNRLCYAKAIYYFMRDKFNYVADPLGVEFVEPPIEALASGGGDCESGSIVMASLMEAVGIDAQLVFVHGHAYVRIWVEEAPKRYKNDNWIYLDWTCDECGFGEIPWENWVKEQWAVEVP
ncbi:hypothetical protein KY320_01225 [Candidatus Woesearchaeota archaeon]|nr:hypothetical protein [Candidatus Woesearchaeota archaeon]